MAVVPEILREVEKLAARVKARHPPVRRALPGRRTHPRGGFL
jgi:hypothetical protein